MYGLLRLSALSSLLSLVSGNTLFPCLVDGSYINKTLPACDRLQTLFESCKHGDKVSQECYCTQELVSDIIEYAMLHALVQI